VSKSLKRASAKGNTNHALLFDADSVDVFDRFLQVLPRALLSAAAAAPPPFSCIDGFMELALVSEEMISTAEAPGSMMMVVASAADRVGRESAESVVSSVLVMELEIRSPKVAGFEATTAAALAI